MDLFCRDEVFVSNEIKMKAMIRKNSKHQILISVRLSKELIRSKIL